MVVGSQPGIVTPTLTRTTRYVAVDLNVLVSWFVTSPRGGVAIFAVVIVDVDAM